ncbi:MAG TPA: thiamine pyrophosphate-dependent enzyme [Vicinamibacterales bacterium]|nr:thiamine pyrophosphate-dependent enzyme [Vicinamibacterales bacterium]
MRKTSIGRRRFLKQAAATGAAVAAAGPVSKAAAQAPAASPARAAAATSTPESDPSPSAEVLTTDRPGGDFMVDVMKSIGFEYVAANPGSSFRGLHESLINYGGNAAPEFITCCHEESSVAMAHGYFKVEGKPMAALVHGTVGLQHAAMALYNAYCDRVPVYVIAGNSIDATQRRPGVEWDHSVQDAAVLVRDFVKWDDLPISLQHFAESAVRAYKIAMTPPMMPVLLVADGGLQEDPIPAERPRIPKLTLALPPQGDSNAVDETARLLVGAESPLIVADRLARTPAGMAHLVTLAELLQAAVVDQGGRMNFPSRHALNQSDRSRELVGAADVILGLELTDFWGTVDAYRDQLHRTSRPIAKAGAKLVSITAGDLFMKANYQDVQRYPEVDIAMAADAEATLPSLIEAVKRRITADRKRLFDDRGRKLADTRQRLLERARADATYGWDASPISTARLSAELWAQIKDTDWALVSPIEFVSRWPMRLWNFDKPYQFIGASGGAGVGYGAPAAVGAALAHKKQGRVVVNIQADGDLMYAPGVLWTAAHHRIPLLSVMHNNRAYHQEVMHIQRMANRHQRGVTSASIGTTIENPNIDYAGLARSLGVHAEGPITDPKELSGAIKRALDVVKRGEPALVDVVSQPR